MKRIYFVRHGESEANAKELFAGRWDVPLTKKGRTQAQQAGKASKNLGIDAIVSSPLRRAKETAQIISAEIGFPVEQIIFSDDFMERSYGELQGKPWSDVSGIDFSRTPGIESEAALLRRAKAGANMLRSLPQDNILLVGHGTNGRAVLHALHNQTGDVEVDIDQEIPNAHPIRWV